MGNDGTAPSTSQATTEVEQCLNLPAAAVIEGGIARDHSHHVFVCHSSLAVGVERSTVSLVKAAKSTGARVTVVVPRPGPILDLLDQIGGVDIVFGRAQWWMGSGGFRGVAKTIQALAQPIRWIPLIKGLNPGVVYVMSTVTPAPMIASKLLGIPLVVFLSESVRDNPDLVSIASKRWLIRRIHSWASVTVAVSHYAADQYGGATLVDAPEVIDLGETTPDHFSRTRGPLRRVVMLGTLSAEKGQFDAVRAVGIAVRAGMELTLDLYGDAHPTERRKLGDLIEELGLTHIVRHRGVTSSPLDVLFASDLSMVCSGHEAYGRVTAESLAVGTPVLGYATGGTAEILEPGGGKLVPVDVERLGEALIALGHDPHEFRKLTEAAARRRTEADTFGDASATIGRIGIRLFSAVGRPTSTS